MSFRRAWLCLIQGNREDLVDSHAVLSEFGNMSSPTVLFILDRMIQREAPRPCVILAFGPGVAIECPFHSGLHIFEDHFYPEVVDPETGRPVADGLYYVVVTTPQGRSVTKMLVIR